MAGSRPEDVAEAKKKKKKDKAKKAMAADLAFIEAEYAKEKKGKKKVREQAK